MMLDARTVSLRSQIADEMIKRGIAERAREEATFAGDARTVAQETSKIVSAKSRIERLRDDLTRHQLKMKNRAARKGL